MALRTFSLIASNWASRRWASAGLMLSSAVAAGLAEREPGDPAVGIVPAAFDPAAIAQTVDQSCQGDRLHFHLFRKFRLLQTLDAFPLGQHRPSRAGNAVARGLFVGIGAHQPLQFAER